MEGNRRYVRVRAVMLAFLLSYYASDSDAFLDEMYIVIPHIIRVLMQRRDLAEEALRRARFQHHFHQRMYLILSFLCLRCAGGIMFSGCPSVRPDFLVYAITQEVYYRISSNLVQR